MTNKNIRLAVVANPSHLEAVDPIVEGKVERVKCIITTGGYGPSFQRGVEGAVLLHKGCKKGLLGGVKTRAPAMGTPLLPPPCAHVCCRVECSHCPCPRLNAICCCCAYRREMIHNKHALCRMMASSCLKKHFTLPPLLC